MKIDYRSFEQLEHTLHQAAADQIVAELASVIAWHKAQQLLEVKRADLARAEADLEAALARDDITAGEFAAAGERLFAERHFEQRHRPPLWDGGTPIRTAHTRDELNERVAVAERELRDANAAKRDAGQRVTGLQQEIKRLQREISLLEAIKPPTAAPGLEAVLNFVR